MWIGDNRATQQCVLDCEKIYVRKKKDIPLVFNLDLDYIERGYAREVGYGPTRDQTKALMKPRLTLWTRILYCTTPSRRLDTYTFAYSRYVKAAR